VVLTLYYLTLGGLATYYLLGLIFPFLFRNIKIKTVIFITFIAIVFGFLNFPYEFDIIGANYKSYTQPITQNRIPYINFQKSNVLPGYFIFAYVVKNFLLLDSVFVQKFIRLLLFVFLLFGVKELAEFVREKYNFPSPFVFFAIFIFAFDWHSSFLLIGNSFRNALGQVFYVFFLLYLLRNQKLRYVPLGIATFLSHKMFLLAVPITFLLFKGLRFVKKFSRLFIFFFFPIASVVFIRLLQFGARHLNILGFGDKFFHPVSTGAEVLGAGIGIWLILIFHAFILVFLYKLFPTLKQKDILFFNAIVLMVNLIASKVNIVGIRFVEPTRFYYFMGPYLALIGAYFLTRVKPKNLILPTLLLWAGYNFALINFSKQAIASTIQLVGKPIFDFWEFYFNLNTSQFLQGVLYILVIIFSTLTVRKKRIAFIILAIFNAVIFLGLYSIMGYIFPLSLLYLILFSIWFYKPREEGIINNLLLNFALFFLWEASYIFLNFTRAQTNLMSTAIESLIIWAFIALIWNFVLLMCYFAKYQKFCYESSKNFNYNGSL